MRPVSRILAATAFVAALFATQARAADWTLDALSFFHFPGSQATRSLPPGIVIPLELSPRRAGVWALRVHAAQFPAKAVSAPNGLLIGVKLKGDAGGECLLDHGTFRCRLAAVFVAVDPAEGKPVYIPLEFTSDSAGRAAAGVEAARAGAPFDPSTGYLQLAAVAERPAGSPLGVGDPFYVVLSGVVAPVPAEMVLESVAQ